MATQTNLEKMNFGKESPGHSSIENTVVVQPAQMVPYPNPSIAGMQSSTLASKKLVVTLKSLASAQQPRTNLEKMNFRREISGHSSIENTVVVQPAQMVPNPDPLIAGLQSSTMALKQLNETLNSLTQQQRVLANKKTNPQLMCAFIKHRISHRQQQQQQRQMLLNEGNMTENHTMRPQQMLPNPNPIADMQSPVAAQKQLLETLKSPASAQQQHQDLAVVQANAQHAPAFLMQKTDQWLQQHQLILQEPQLTVQKHELFLQKMEELFHRRKERIIQRRLRRQILLERNITGYSAVRPHRVLPNLDPSVADMQRPTEDWQQMLETLKALNLEENKLT